VSFKILFSNLGYARGIDGTFSQHIRRIHRHFYTGLTQQQQVLSQFRNIIIAEKPDLCCLVEVDSGSWNTGYFNQMDYLTDQEYPVYDIAGKYGEDSLLARMPFFSGKCSAFLSKTELSSRKLYFRHGSKRLIYSIALPGGATLFFAHFSLQARVRAKQLEEVRTLVADGGESIILADFNILQGFRELQPLLRDKGLCVLNKEDDHTFMFGSRRWTLDLCLCSQSLMPRLQLRIIPQPFSDHAALLVEMAGL
jgi:endonuclease/exonuclease/phosphatase family metal-dependent hydrolase